MNFNFNAKKVKLAGIFFTAFLYSSMALADATKEEKAEPLIPQAPKLAAKSWVLMDVKSGKILAQQDENLRLPPASLTKMMTVYVADKSLANGQISLEDEVTVSVKAWRAVGSKMFLQEGKTVKVDDLFKGIIIQSGNDASIALAEHVGGSEDAFVDLMNRQAQSMGLKNTHFNNATGLPSSEHYSTAYDLAQLGRHIILDFPESYSVYSQKQYTYNGITQDNRNVLLNRDTSVDGIKTGHTEEAGYCLVASAMREDMRLIAAVLGTNSIEARAQETLKLLTYGFRYYNTVKLYNKLEKITTHQAYYGAKNQVTLGLAEDLFATVKRGMEDRISVKVTPQNIIEAPIQVGDSLGKMEVFVGDKLLKSLDLIALENVETAGFFGRMWDGIKLFFAKLF